MLPWQLVYYSACSNGLTTCREDGDYSLPVLQKLIEGFELYAHACFCYFILRPHHLEPVKHSSESKDSMSARRHAAKPCVNYLGLMLENLGVPFYVLRHVYNKT